ncbi:MAG: hypothetical protein ABR540_04730, partial [Acidimicrobiales bacterium]
GVTTSRTTTGSLDGMAKSKASVSLDATKVEQARELLGTPSLSELIDIALDRLIMQELDRRHAAGYLREPPTEEEASWAAVEREPGGIADDVDWAQLYGIEPPK